MKSISNISGISLRITVLTCYVTAILAGGGLHIHVEQSHSDNACDSGHITLHAHAHSHPGDTNPLQLYDLAHPIHSHAIAEFQYTATRGKKASESLHSDTPAQQAVLVNPADLSSIDACWKNHAGCTRQFSTEHFCKDTPSRAPPAA